MKENALFDEQMKDLLKDEYDAYKNCLQSEAYRGFRINPLKTDADHFFEIFHEPHEKSPFSEYGYYLNSDLKVSKDILWHAGLYYMQEPSAGCAVTAMGIEPGMRVLDLCAAPGSKSTQIAELLGNEGFLVVNEISRKRASVLLENIERHGSSCTMVLNEDTAHIADVYEGFFDAVLCDAPCSGEGMFRKEPQASEDWSPANIGLCVKRQAMILDNAYRCLKEGGVLVYSTCTFNTAENEEQVLHFLERHPDMHMEEIDEPFGRSGFDFGRGTDLSRRIFPMDKGEGHFTARMRKEGSGRRKDAPLLKGDRIPKACTEFLKEQCEDMYPYLYAYKNRIYGGTAPFYEYGRLRILRHQVLLGEMKGKDFVPSHHFWRSSFTPFRRVIGLSEEDLDRYLAGAEIASDTERGWYAVSCGGFVYAGTKCDGRHLKNKLPAALRMRSADET